MHLGSLGPLGSEAQNECILIDGEEMMAHLLLQWNPAPSNGDCGLCGCPTQAVAGTQLVLSRTDDLNISAAETLVCPECGRRHAPALTALLQLTYTAERVGRIGRHTVFPPYTALLELARAADAYLSAGGH